MGGSFLGSARKASPARTSRVGERVLAIANFFLEFSFLPIDQFLHRCMLLVNRKLRITDDVDEGDMSDLELDLFFGSRGH
jgi:hypothetical protein